MDLVVYRLQLLRRYSANGLEDKCHLLSRFATTKMEPEPEPAKVMRRGDQVAKELPRIGKTVDHYKKHVVAPRRLKQYIIM